MKMKCIKLQVSKPAGNIIFDLLVKYVFRYRVLVKCNKYDERFYYENWLASEKIRMYAYQFYDGYGKEHKTVYRDGYDSNSNGIEFFFLSKKSDTHFKLACG